MPTGRKRSTDANRATVDRDELERMLERDTAVQGEPAADAPDGDRGPAGPDDASHPAPESRKNEKS